MAGELSTILPLPWTPSYGHHKSLRWTTSSTWHVEVWSSVQDCGLYYMVCYRVELVSMDTTLVPLFKREPELEISGISYPKVAASITATNPCCS